MSQVVIDNPIINSPFAEPTRHFRFSDEGIPDEVINHYGDEVLKVVKRAAPAKAKRR